MIQCRSSIAPSDADTPPFQRCKWMFGFSFAKQFILELLQVCVCWICCLDGLLFFWQKKPSTIQPYGILSGEHNHSINQYHISLWDIKCFVVHCHAMLLWNLLYNKLALPDNRNRAQNQQNKYFTCYMTVCNATNSPMHPKDNKSGENS